MGQTLAVSETRYAWEVIPPFADNVSEDLVILPWLHELRMFRGSLLYGEASLPSSEYFHSTPDDPDPFDGICYHIIARIAGRIAGCIRISGALEESELRAYFLRLGLESYEGWRPHFSGRIGVSGRLITAPEYRSLGLANRFIAASYVLTRMLDLSHVLAIVGTAYGSDRILIRTGAKSVPGVGTFATRTFRIRSGSCP